jgi:hypothetical protein
MSVDQGFARWLREGILFASVSDAPTAATWGALARETEIRSPLALAAGAEAEAARQLAFLKGPLVEDELVVDGLRGAELLGRAWTVTMHPPEGAAPAATRQLGYEVGVSVFVIAYQEQEDADLTTLFVLRTL